MGSMAGVSPTFSHMVAITVRMAHSYFLPTFIEYLPVVTNAGSPLSPFLHVFFVFFLSLDFLITQNVICKQFVLLLVNKEIIWFYSLHELGTIPA